MWVLNPTILAKYRKVDWVFAFYEGIVFKSLYLMRPSDLEPLFAKWEKHWHERGGKDLNNPKVPGTFVRANGKRLR